MDSTTYPQVLAVKKVADATVIKLPVISTRAEMLVAEVRDQLYQKLDETFGPVILDVADVTSLGSTLLGALLTAESRAERAGRYFVLAGLTDLAKRVIVISQNDTRFYIADTVESALASIP